MAVYYKFKSARDYDSIHMEGPFISVGTLKEKIFESKRLGSGTDFDLMVANAQTNEEYLDEEMLIPKNTSVLIRRVPGRLRVAIVTQQEPKVEKIEESQREKSSIPDTHTLVMNYPEDSEWDDFGNDLYAIPEVRPTQSSKPTPDVLTTDKVDEETKIKAFIETPALDWQHHGSDGFRPGKGFGRDACGRMGRYRFGQAGFEQRTLPPGYVCHRCKVPGHFIQDCPTNGDPNYDRKRVKPPTGIPKSMLMATPEGTYALPSGAVAVLKPNEAAFEKEVEGIPSTRSVSDLPPELHCPLCKRVMKDAVLTSKCCYNSFCDKCIRNQIISKVVCVCGATNILADDLLPNKTLRDTINRILESGNCSAEKSGSTCEIKDIESAHTQSKVSSPTLSAASKGEQKLLHVNEETAKTMEIAGEGKVTTAPKLILEEVRTSKVANVSEATHESIGVKEPAPQGSAPVIEEELQQNLVACEAGKKKKKTKARMTPPNDLQWNVPQDITSENCTMPMGPAAYNSYWSGMQSGMDGFMAPYAGAMPSMGYGYDPLDLRFGGVMSLDPFGAQVNPYLQGNSFGAQGNPYSQGNSFGAQGNPYLQGNSFGAQGNPYAQGNSFGVQGNPYAQGNSFGAQGNPYAQGNSFGTQGNPYAQGNSFGAQGHMFSHAPPRRDLAQLHMGMNVAPHPSMSREEFEARKADAKRKRENGRLVESKDLSRDRELGREMSNRAFGREMSNGGDVPSLKSIHKPVPQTLGRYKHEDQQEEAMEPARRPPNATIHRNHRSDSESSARRMSNQTDTIVKNKMTSVSYHIGFRPRKEDDQSTDIKQRNKSSSSNHKVSSSNGYYGDDHHKISSIGIRKRTAVDYEPSDDDDDDRHFKRKSRRYETSPPQRAAAEEEESRRFFRGSREHRDRNGLS